MQILANFIKSILNFLLPKTYLPVDSKSGLWIDWADDTEIQKRRNRESIKTFKDKGYVILSKLIPNQLCDELNQKFSKYVESNHEEARSAEDSFGFHSRLCNFHMFSSKAKEIAFHKTLVSILDEIFSSEAVLCSSLYFEKGSEQRIHRDGPFFYTVPKNLFVGVWVALEDIQEGTGELVYFPKGHLIPISVEKIIQEGGGWSEYSKAIESKCRQLGLGLEKNLAKKGDVLIWHAELPHGGSKIDNSKQSRKSIVFHYKAKLAPIHGEDVFFSKAPVPKFSVFSYKSYNKRKYIDQGIPFFAKNEY
ncbi:hypothetical protein LPTSP4_25210 [Leptospira ryugenii]|uniref:Phytanoyl-CoA dioxygenase PhyH n=1 Tax=Leptospira ryugenii TaxID=1917863 RepID=A0A2P2E294_9LEPT|nr:phytanoyl-CoA dioxygenase family protein [Leptospira ryugenii]GBF50990.1 hypothetical protein LPTSP4_25210 [Leptospira ryugenii]